MNTKALPFVTMVGFMFGSTLVASRFSVGQFAPTTYLGLRLCIASLAHLFLYATFAQRFSWPKDRTLWQHASLLGVLGTAVPMTFIVSSLQYLSSGMASILITTGPAITVVMAHFFLADEQLNRGKLVGVTLALGGAVMLTLSGESGITDVGKADPRGYVMLLTAVVLSNAAAIYIRKYLNGYSVYDVASIRMFVAALFVMPLSLLFVGFDLSRVTSTGYMALVYAALVGTFGGLLFTVFNIKRFGATAAAMTAYTIPPISVILGALLLDETITAVMILGMLLIIAGVVMINRFQQTILPETQPVVGN